MSPAAAKPKTVKTWYVTENFPFPNTGSNNNPLPKVQPSFTPFIGPNNGISSTISRHTSKRRISNYLTMKSGPAAVDQAVLMDKWSLKPADHNAIRVRNNQRRHRARVKSRMEELEARLERTSADLKAALSTISVLTAELEALRGSKASCTHHVGAPAVPAPPLAAAPSPPVTPPSSLHSPETDLSQPSDFQQTLPIGVPTSSLDHDIVIATTPAAVDDNIEEGPNCDCQGLPPSAPGESMMSCDLAFQIVKQQNHSGLEVATIRSWLGPGFRKALRPGGMCRVETNRLYEIIDLITSSGETAGQLLHPS